MLVYIFSDSLQEFVNMIGITSQEEPDNPHDSLKISR